MIKQHMDDILLLLGTLITAAGLAMIYIPAAFLFVGIVTMAFSIVISLPKKRG